MIDLGCGSGVLAIAAAKLGWGKVLALDYDQLAVDATLENAAVNGVADLIEVRRFNLLREPVPPAPLVLANLLRPLLLAWSAAMAGTAHGQIIASGLLIDEADSVSRSFARARLPRAHPPDGGRVGGAVARSAGPRVASRASASTSS